MATEGVLKYLQSTNRPYSANDIVLNMHKEFGKTAVQKALDDLVTQAQVLEKAYGKQKIYCVKQPDDKSAGETELTDLDSEVSMDFVIIIHILLMYTLYSVSNFLCSPLGSFKLY